MENWKHYLLDQRNNIIVVLFFLLSSVFVVIDYFNEFLFIYSILFIFYSIIDTFFIRTNSYFIIIRTRKHYYIPALALFLTGLIVLFLGNSNSHAFNFIPVKIFMGIFLIANSLLILPKNIIINKYGIYVNEMLTRKIDYSELDGFVLSENTLTVSNKDFSYHYKIYPLTSDEIDLINNRINEYQNIQS